MTKVETTKRILTESGLRPVVEAAAREHRVGLTLLLGGSHMAHVVAARREVCGLLYQEHRLSLRGVATLLGIARRTVALHLDALGVVRRQGEEARRAA